MNFWRTVQQRWLQCWQSEISRPGHAKTSLAELVGKGCDAERVAELVRQVTLILRNRFGKRFRDAKHYAEQYKLAGDLLEAAEQLETAARRYNALQYPLFQKFGTALATCLEIARGEERRLRREVPSRQPQLFPIGGTDGPLYELFAYVKEYTGKAHYAELVELLRIGSSCASSVLQGGSEQEIAVGRPKADFSEIDEDSLQKRITRYRKSHAGFASVIDRRHRRSHAEAERSRRGKEYEEQFEPTA